MKSKPSKPTIDEILEPFKQYGTVNNGSKLLNGRKLEYAKSAIEQLIREARKSERLVMVEQLIDDGFLSAQDYMLFKDRLAELQRLNKGKR